MNKIGETIRKHRKLAGLTQQQLAQKLGISASSVGMYEQGRRAVNNDLLLKFCEQFGISADSLLGVPEHPCEATEVIQEMSDRIRYSDRIMLNGIPMGAEDRERLLDAIEVATRLALYKKKK